MIGATQRNKALGMFRGGEDRARILDPDEIIGRRVEYQQGLAQVCEAVMELSLRHIVQELLADAEGTSGERDFNLAFRMDVGDMLLEQAGDVRRVGWCRNRDDRPRLRAILGGREHRGPAKAV